MMKHEVRNEAQALIYIVDCTLATVCTMAMKKNPPKYELSRQIGIAQAGVKWIEEMSLDPRGTRASTVIYDFNGDVAKWAETYRPLAP